MSVFNGFQSPNFTQIPNEYLEYTFSPTCKLSKVQMQIMNIFFRETFGWQDKNKVIILSINDIIAILDLKKRNTVVDALTGLVEEENFLESIEVGKLPKKVRQNIEVSLDRTLQPRQKLYRLNLADRKNKSWDFAERTHINIQERKIQSSNQKVTTLEGSNQNGTTLEIEKESSTSNQKGTTLEAESLDVVGSDQSLNKGLNKGLNKEEEELVTLADVILFLNEQITKREITNQKTIKAIMEVASKCRAIGSSDFDSMENYCIKVVEEKMSKLGQKQRSNNTKKTKTNSSIRKEITPDWLKENKTSENTYAGEQPVIQESLKSTEEIEKFELEKKKLFDRIKKYKEAK